MAIYEDLEIEQGSSFAYIVSVKDPNGAAYGLGSHTLAAQMKKTYTSSSVTASFTAATTSVAGEIKISLTDEQTAAIKAGRYVNDVLIETPSNEKHRVIEGMITVTPGVTTIS